MEATAENDIFTLDGVPMRVYVPSEGIEQILAETIFRTATGSLAAQFRKLNVMGMGSITKNGRSTLWAGAEKKDWTLILGTDGSGTLECFIDTGVELKAIDMLCMSEGGISAPSDLMDKLKAYR